MIRRKYSTLWACAVAVAETVPEYTEAILTDVDPSEFEDLRDELQGFLHV